MIVRVIQCDSCGNATACRHSGMRWLCAECWTAIIDPPAAA